MTSLFQGLSARFPAFRVPFDFLLALRVFAMCSTEGFENTQAATKHKELFAYTSK